MSPNQFVQSAFRPPQAPWGPADNPAMRGCHRSSRTSDEAGFALVETLVSAVVLIVIAIATLAAVDRAQSTSAIGKGRSVASSLA
jgi:type II secretory pathway pseudopilin PulG